MALPSSEVLWDHLRRHFADKHEVTVEALLTTLAAEKHVVERAEVVALYQEWDRQKLGDFIVGRRRRKTRIWLNKTPRETKSPPAFLVRARPPAAPSRKVELPLSEARAVMLEFPSDLSPTDVDRIASFLRFFISTNEPGPAAA